MTAAASTENSPCRDNKTASSLTIRIAVGSTNPAKLRAVEQAVQRTLQQHHTTSSTVQLDLQGFAVASGVPDQPFGDDQTCRGAQNRSRAAHAAFRRANQGLKPHLAIGMEGGLERKSTTTQQQYQQQEKEAEERETKVLFCMAWMSIYGRREAFTVDIFASQDTKTYYGDRKPIFGLAKTASFALPHRIHELVEHEGLELGEADDQVFDRTNSKHGSGTVGLLTNGLIDRSHYYEHALVMALMPWIRPDLYPKGL